MHHFLFLHRKFSLAKRSGKSRVEKGLNLTQSIGLVLLAVLRFILVLMLYLSQDREMMWLFYIYVFLDLPVKIFFPPAPILWIKYLVRIYLSKVRLWRYFIRLMLWDTTLLLLMGWVILETMVYPIDFERLTFPLMAIVFSLMDSLMAFILLLFSRKIDLAMVLTILAFGMALGAISIHENGLTLLVLAGCFLVQWLLFTLLVKKEMFAI